MDGSIATCEEMIKKYPDSASLALALQTLLQSQRMLLGAELKSAPDVEQYFQSLADSAPSPNAKSKILFTLANYVAEQDKARALTIMTEAYKPEIVYSPQDIDFYGLALIGQKKLDEAAGVSISLPRTILFLQMSRQTRLRSLSRRLRPSRSSGRLALLRKEARRPRLANFFRS